MKNKSANQSRSSLKVASKQPSSNPGLSDDALYLMALGSRLKKLLGAASLSHFIATGEEVVFTNKATG